MIYSRSKELKDGKVYTFGYERVDGSIESLAEDIKSYSISGFTYKDGHRKKPNIEDAGNIIMVDIDNSQRLRFPTKQEAENAGGIDIRFDKRTELYGCKVRMTEGYMSFNDTVNAMEKLGWEGLVHTSRSSTMEWEKIHVFIHVQQPLPVNRNVYIQLFNRIVSLLEIPTSNIDSVSYGQAMQFAPTVEGAAVRLIKGTPVDSEDILDRNYTEFVFKDTTEYADLHTKATMNTPRLENVDAWTESVNVKDHGEMSGMELLELMRGGVAGNKVRVGCIYGHEHGGDKHSAYVVYWPDSDRAGYFDYGSDCGFWVPVGLDLPNHDDPFVESEFGDTTEVEVKPADKVQTTETQPDYVYWRDLSRARYAIYNKKNSVVKYLNKEFFTHEFLHLNPGLEKVPFKMLQSRHTVFDPTIPHKFYVGEDGQRYYNMFTPTAAMEIFNSAESCAMPEVIGRIIDNAIPNEEFRNLWLHNLAYHLTHFTVGMTSTLLIGRLGGEGKGLIMSTLMNMIYGDYFRLIDKDALLDRFSGYMEGALYIYVDEVEEGRYETRVLDALKLIIANKSIGMRAMQRDAVKIPNYAVVGISSNRAIPVAIDSHEDRRFNITESNRKQLKFLSWFPADVTGVMEAELAAFMGYLKGIKLDAGKYSKVLDTEVKRDIYRDSMSKQMLVATAIMEGNVDSLLDEAVDELGVNGIINKIENKKDIKINDLCTVFGFEVGSQHAKIFTRDLKHSGLEVKRKTISGSKFVMLILETN